LSSSTMVCSTVLLAAIWTIIAMPVGAIRRIDSQTRENTKTRSGLPKHAADGDHPSDQTRSAATPGTGRPSAPRPDDAIRTPAYARHLPPIRRWPASAP
jgi:hypothetical protein